MALLHNESQEALWKAGFLGFFFAEEPVMDWNSAIKDFADYADWVIGKRIPSACSGQAARGIINRMPDIQAGILYRYARLLVK